MAPICGRVLTGDGPLGLPLGHVTDDGTDGLGRGDSGLPVGGAEVGGGSGQEGG